MQTRILAALLCGCAAAGAAVADTLVVNDQVQVRESQLDRPKRGSTMGEVEKHFGAPVARDPTVGLQRLFGVLRARPRDSRSGDRRLRPRSSQAPACPRRGGRSTNTSPTDTFDTRLSPDADINAGVILFRLRE